MNGFTGLGSDRTYNRLAVVSSVVINLRLNNSCLGTLVWAWTYSKMKVGTRREQVRRKRVPMRCCRSEKPAKSTTSVFPIMAGCHPTRAGDNARLSQKFSATKVMFADIVERYAGRLAAFVRPNAKTPALGWGCSRHPRERRGWALAAVTIAMGTIGFVDDEKESLLGQGSLWIAARLVRVYVFDVAMADHSTGRDARQLRREPLRKIWLLMKKTDGGCFLVA